jgi:hypothetical protein
MALPWVLGVVGADFHTEQEERNVDLYPALEYCSGPADRYHGFGLPWPIYSVPSLACLANQSQGGHYHDEPIHATNGFQE